MPAVSDGPIDRELIFDQWVWCPVCKDITRHRQVGRKLKPTTKIKYREYLDVRKVKYRCYECQKLVVMGNELDEGYQWIRKDTNEVLSGL